MICKFISGILDQSYDTNNFMVDGCLSYTPGKECTQYIQIWHYYYYKESYSWIFSIWFGIHSKDFLSFFNVSTVLILPDFSDLKVILLFHPSINAQVCLECLKLPQSLHFIDKYKKKKWDAIWKILPS